MKEELSKYGMSEKEIDVYLAALKTGMCTANRLSELTNIRRSTVYEIVQSLKNKGLINFLEKDKKMFFSASKPSALIDVLRDKEKLIQSILPELNNLSSSITEKPKLEMFEGLVGIKVAAEDMLNYKEILVYGASNLANTILDLYASNFSKKRVEKKIILKAIIEKNIPKHMLEKDVMKFTKIRTSNTFNDHSSVYFIYGDKFLVMTFKEELMAFRVTSPILIDSQKKLFDFLWSKAK